MDNYISDESYKVQLYKCHSFICKKKKKTKYDDFFRMKIAVEKVKSSRSGLTCKFINFPFQLITKKNQQIAIKLCI